MVLRKRYASDELWATFAPIGVYWVYAGFYQLLMLLPSMENYRLHTKNEENDKNSVSLASVIKGVLLQQLMQVAIALFIFQMTSNTSPSALGNIQPSIPIQVVQIIIAMLVMDTWQYFAHRYMHQNKFLYKHVHSWHHRLVVPYAIGAMYNHPIEGILLDTCSGAVAYLISGMTARTSTVFYCIAVIKGVEHHCGLWLPGNIFQHLFFHNNAAYHDIHHQLKGTKYNFSQPFFPIWDKLLGTYKTFQVVRRPGGGFKPWLLRTKMSKKKR